MSRERDFVDTLQLTLHLYLAHTVHSGEVILSQSWLR